MVGFLGEGYLWVKALHIIFVIFWMAGLFMMPRFFAYHLETDSNSPETGKWIERERRLQRIIMNPAMICTWIFGLCLVFTPGIVDWSAGWSWVKALSVLAMTWFHHWLAKRRKEFVSGENTRTGRQYRMMNELPTVLMIVIVIMINARTF